MLNDSNNETNVGIYSYKITEMMKNENDEILGFREPRPSTRLCSYFCRCDALLFRELFAANCILCFPAHTPLLTPVFTRANETQAFKRSGDLFMFVISLMSSPRHDLIDYEFWRALHHGLHLLISIQVVSYEGRDEGEGNGPCRLKTRCRYLSKMGIRDKI